LARNEKWMNQDLLNFKYPLPDLPPRGKEIFSPLGEIRKGVKIYVTMFNS